MFHHILLLWTRGVVAGMHLTLQTCAAERGGARLKSYCTESLTVVNASNVVQHVIFCSQPERLQ